ncbi:hypothetical protein HOR43_gp31 [Streptomyces phage Ididsumtinwong]|uniref:Uncharacterized protein n=2 Tax=Austintatiousvirus ididsumtinwong TaxID=2734220 RepID=A0A1J0MCE4_9CAUD|nr:hypothetical protein HOR43_gp31 [Streptomyces phage Ididsumtinwong]APD18526.1 hypothetical protein SEA_IDIDSUMTINWONG_51 [Streptomyces phage Ididsumtinwong]APD18742.1 hypothetical protein SEA_BIOSCUM_50 [Streptomyces phage Bioscum]
MDVTIPGALADHLSRADLTTGPAAKHPAAADLRIALDNARRGRGRTLVIPAHGTAVLHLISAFAEAILENRKLHTPSEVRASRLWIQRAGHAPATTSTPAPAPAPTPRRDEPSNWWTITDPASGEEVVRVYGETYQDMTPRAEALPEVRAVIRKHRGFSRRRLFMSELTPAQLDEQRAQEQPPTPDPTPAVEPENAQHAVYRARAAKRLRDALVGSPAAFEPETVEDVEARRAAELVTEAEATAGTWRGQWIGEHPDAMFPARPDREQGSLFA